MTAAGARSRASVVLVEDSPTQARAIARMLEADGDLQVVATATTATEAIEAVVRHRPDLAVMDLDIPHGGGALAIDRIMRMAPTPILVLSGTIDGSAAPAAVGALAVGAVEAMPKPRAWTPAHAADLRRLARRVRGIPVIARRRRIERPQPAAPLRREPGRRNGTVIGIAASTGGPAAVATVLTGLRGLGAPVLIVQHIHPSFVESFATWLGRTAGTAVALARDGERLARDGVYVSPGNCHLALGRGRTLAVEAQPESLHRPSADVLFHSLAEHAGTDAIGVVLTGMGTDGSRGLAALRAAGGQAFAQDEATSVVYGMPAAAVRTGAVDAGLPLAELAPAVRAALAERVL
jgi:two-component system chemotaxis response regulator CheB